MRSFYKAELIGQIIAGALFLAILGMVVYAISQRNTAVAITGTVAAGASVIWAVRRRSNSGPSSELPVDLASAAVEGVDEANEGGNA